MTIKQKILKETLKLKAEELDEDNLDWLDDNDEMSSEEVKRLYSEHTGIPTGDKKQKGLTLEERRAKLPLEKDYSELEAEQFAYDWLVEKVEKELELLKCVQNPVEERKRYEVLLKTNKKDYADWNYAVVENDVRDFLYEFVLPQPSQKTKLAVLNAFMRANIQFLEYAFNYLCGKRENLSRQLIQGVDEYIGSRNIVSCSPDAGECGESTFNLIELTELYNNDLSRDNTSDEEKNKVMTRMKVVSEIIGDMSISKITDKNIESFIRELKCLPANYGKMKMSKNFTTNQAIEIGKRDSSILKVSNGTVEKYVQTLNTILRYAVRKEYLAKNPFDRISLPKPDKKKDKENKRLPFSIPQLQAIFSQPVFTGCMNDKIGWNTKGNKIFRNYKFWIPLIGLYTGARLNEICQLLVEDIKQVDGVDVISITIDNDENKKVKTSAAIRMIPIHNELKKIGFMEFVEEVKSKKQKRLFSELEEDGRGRYSGRFSQIFGRFLKEVDKTIKNENDKFKKGSTYHSFRHTFRDSLRDNECNQEAVRSLGGWEGERNDLSDYYGKGFSMQKLNEILNSKLIYHGLDLSKLYL